MKTEPQRTCPICGNEFSGAMEFCPVCMLRKALAGDVESGESFASEDTLKPAPEQATQRFEHYELAKGEDGKPIELGRGAMGITYKAFDIDLHCPVTLKVISERYVGDESVAASFPSGSARGGERSSSKRCLGFPSGQKSGELLLREGFRGVNWALLVGSVPRKQGMERKELLGINGKIFTGQGRAIGFRRARARGRKSAQHQLPDCYE